MEGRRGPYYDGSGALRDVIQNHGLQLLCLVAMEPPALFGHKEIRDEKVKVLRSLRPWTQERLKSETVRGQYVAGSIGEKPRPPFRSEEGVDPKSMTETFVGMRTFVDNWRWSGVPFLLRTGKCLPKRSTEIAIEFKQPPLQLFTTVECEGEVCDITQARPNVLVFRIQPDEGISLSFSAKRPGMLFQIHPVEMDFIYNQSFKVSLPEAYERLLLDAMRDDSTLFTRSDEVEAAWEFCEPMLQAWASNDSPPLYFYEAGTWGPHEADQLWAGYSGGWRNR
jgi:glucose-6-phosphate 1-dehydrogenase